VVVAEVAHVVRVRGDPLALGACVAPLDRRRDQVAGLPVLVLLARVDVLEPDAVRESLVRLDRVAVVVVIGAVVGVHEDEHVVVGVLRAHVVVADDHLPVGAEAVPADHDRRPAGQGLLDPDGVEQLLRVLEARLQPPLAGDARLVKAREDTAQLGERGEPSPLGVRPPQRDHVLLVEVLAHAEPVEHAQGRRHAAGPAGDLQTGPITAEDGEGLAGRGVVEVDERPVRRFGEVGEVGDATPVADPVTDELSLAHRNAVPGAVERPARDVVDRRPGLGAHSVEPGHAGVPVAATAGAGDDQDAVGDLVAVDVPELDVTPDQPGARIPLPQPPGAAERVRAGIGDLIHDRPTRDPPQVHPAAVEVAEQCERSQALPAAREAPVGDRLRLGRLGFGRLGHGRRRQSQQEQDRAGHQGDRRDVPT